MAKSFGAPRGMTFVEVIVTVLIIGVLATVAVLRFADALDDSRADMAMNRIICDLKMAQARARATSSSQTVVFTAEAPHSEYYIEGLIDPDHPAQTYTVSLSEEPYFAAITRANCGNDATLVFNGYGLPDSDGTIVIQVGSHVRTVQIDAANGNATREN